MDVGQMTMLQQLPVGAGLSTTTPAPSTVTTTPGGALDSVFSGLLSGMSPTVSSQPLAAGGGGKAGNLEAPDVNKQAVAAVQPEVQPDVMAMLLAAMGSGNQQSPANAPLGEDTQDTSAKVVKPDDAPTSLGAASSGAGTQSVPPDVMAMLLAATGNGNQLFPASGSTTNDSQEQVVSVSAVQSIASTPQDVALSVAGADAPAQADNGRMPDTDAMAQQPDDAVRQNSPADVLVAASLPVNDAGSQPDGSAVQNGAGKTTSGMAAVGGTPEKGPSLQPSLAPSEGGMSQVVKAQVSAGSQQAVPVPPKSTASVVQTDADSTTGSKKEALLSGSAPGTKPIVSETSTDKPDVGDIGKEVSKTTEAAASHAPLPETSSAGNQQPVDHAPEKPANMAENAAKSSIAPQIAAGKDDLADSSDTGSSGKKLEDFMKPVETPTTVTQQVGAHQLFPAETATSVQPQSVQAETLRPESHEVARQVQDQLAGYNLKQGSDQITLRLSPDHLGDIKVNLNLEDQRLKVEIVTETRGARDSLLQHVDSLKESLARQNISIDKFDVTTGGGGAGNQSNNNAQGAWNELAKNRQAQQWLSSGGYRTPSVAATPSVPVYLVQAEHTMVDVHF